MEFKRIKRLLSGTKRKEPEMNETLTSSSKSLERLDKDSENIRYSPKYFADNLPPLQKKRNGKQVAKTILIQKPQQLAKTEEVKPFRKFQDEYNLRIPINLFPWLKEVEANPPDTIPGFKISHLMYILHLIASKIEEDGFSRLVMRYLRRIVSRADFYIKFLIDEKIIKRTSYKKGQAFGYKITDKYESEYFKIALGDPKLLRKIRKLYAKLNKKNNQYPTQCRLIESITIDPKAEEFAKSFYKGEKLKYALSCITKIQNKEFFHIVDDTGERFHSNITNLPKELRKFIRVNGKLLTANCDIKNSQLDFSIMILTNPKKCIEFAKSRKLRIVLKNLQIPDNENVRYYKNLSISGEFYEFLWDEFYKRGIIFQGKRHKWEPRRRYKIPDRKKILADKDNYDEIRQDIKTMAYRILFDRNREKPSRAKQTFIELFPPVDEIFSKVRGNERGNKFENNSRFSILLQNMESHVILKKTLKRVYKENHVAMTVHDSQLVTDNPERIADIMTEELLKFLGFKPKIEIEQLQEGGREREKGEEGRGIMMQKPL